MDPDAALASLRRAIGDWLAAPICSTAQQTAGANLVEAAQSLDTWLSDGGFAPKDWQPPARSGTPTELLAQALSHRGWHARAFPVGKDFVAKVEIRAHAQDRLPLVTVLAPIDADDDWEWGPRGYEHHDPGTDGIAALASAVIATLPPAIGATGDGGGAHAPNRSGT